MPKVTFFRYLSALPDSIAFSGLAFIAKFIVMVFFVGDILMSARLLIIGFFAVIDRMRKPYHQATPGYNPRVAVLIPAYNEENRHRPHHPLSAQLRLQKSPRHRH